MKHKSETEKKLKPRMKLKQKVFFSGEEKLGEETRRLIEESEERREKEERNTVFRFRFVSLSEISFFTTIYSCNNTKK